jgi:hypothetical protein
VNTDLFFNSLKTAEDRYLRAKQQFLEEAVSDPSTAVALSGSVVRKQSHFESLKVAEGYINADADYPSSLDAVQAAIDYFKTVLIRGIEFGRSSCDISNGVDVARLNGVRDTFNVLEQVAKSEEATK